MRRRIVCYGDSNTYGYDPRSYLGGRYPESVRWTARLRAAGWDVANEGVNGCSIPTADWEIGAAAQAVCLTRAEVLAVMLGSNDLLQCPGLNAETCGGRMERFLTVLSKEVSGSLEILLVAPPPMKRGAWVSDPGTLEESRRLAGCYQTLAQRLGTSFADAGDWDVELAYDGVHFSETGHRAFAEGMRRKLEMVAAFKDGF